MLTIRFDELGLRPGSRVLDVGAGFGRHVYECARRGARSVALDYAEKLCKPDTHWEQCWKLAKFRLRLPRGIAWRRNLTPV